MDDGPVFKIIDVIKLTYEQTENQTQPSTINNQQRQLPQNKTHHLLSRYKNSILHTMKQRKSQEEVFDGTTSTTNNDEKIESMVETTAKKQVNDPPLTIKKLPSSSSSSQSPNDSAGSGNRKKRSRKSMMTNICSKNTNSNEHRATIRITQEDHDRVLQLLQSIDWSMAKNTSRKNVIRDNNDPLQTPQQQQQQHLRTNKGKPYCQSFIFGRNMKDPNYEYSYWSLQYPTIYQELQTFFQKYNTTHFTYTHITLNKNLQCKRHTDGGNMGLSYIIAVGNYTGGALLIDDTVGDVATLPPPSTKTTSNTSASVSKKSKSTSIHNNNNNNNNNSTIFNLHRTFVLFNGKEQPHETLPFTGERYTLVYYTSDIVPKDMIRTTDHHDMTIRHNDRPTISAWNETKDHPSAIRTGSTTMASHNQTVSQSLTTKFNAMKKKLGRRR